MIVQCSQCSTRFRLDDTKIKESGIKVRCSKCRNVFIVYPETPAVPQAAPDSAAFPDDFFTVPQPREEQAPQQAEAAEPAGAAESPSPPDADDWFSPGQPESVPPASAGATEEFDLGFEPTPAVHAPTESAIGGERDGEFDFFVSDRENEPVAEKPAEQPPAAASHDIEGAGFETASVPEFDFQEAAMGPGGDEESAEQGFLASPDAGFDAVFADAGAEASPPEEAAAEKVEADTVGGGEPSAAAADETIVPPAVAEEQEELPPLSIGSRRRSHSAVPIIVAVISVVFVLVLAVGGFLFMSEGPEAFKKMGLGFLVELAGLQQADDGTITVRGTRAEFVLNKEAGELFVVRGEAVNGFSKPRASIQVRALMYNGKGEVVARKTAFCGNALTKEQVSTLPLTKIDAAMGNQFGDSLSNLGIQPGKAIPFVIVLPNVSRDAAEYGIEVAGSTVASQ